MTLCQDLCNCKTCCFIEAKLGRCHPVKLTTCEYEVFMKNKALKTDSFITFY